jgi:hypothetical protein
VSYYWSGVVFKGEGERAQERERKEKRRRRFFFSCPKVNNLHLFLPLPPPQPHKTDLGDLLKEHATNPTHAEFELAKVQGMLDAIDSARLANTPQEFGVGKDGKVPAGQAVCHSLLEECYRLVRKIQEKE